MTTMTNPAYHPRPGTLAAKLIAYLEITPRAQLKRAEVADMFEVAPNSLEASLDTAVKYGALAKYRNAEGENIWCLPSMVPPTPTPQAIAQASPFYTGSSHPTPPAARSTSTAVRNLSTPKRGAVSLPASALDFSSLKAEVGIPLLGKGKGEIGVSKWQPLLDLLTAPDTSVEFPAEWKSAVAAQTTKLNVQAKKDGQATQYKVRLVSADKARIWRLA
jgi:hypothetical protein